jgi:glutathione reductase (NADPH)
VLRDDRQKIGDNHGQGRLRETGADTRAKVRTMTGLDHDLIVIGAGSGGVAAARRAASHGARVTICEERRVGGTCVLRGCVPKKLLMYGAQFRDHIDDARGFGWSVADARLDWGRLVANKNRELERLHGVYRRMLSDAGVTLLEGRARLLDANTVELGGARHTARYVIVATGGHPVLPEEIHGLQHVITSDAALDLAALPERIVIIGGGYIGVEFASIFGAAGSHVTLVIRHDMVLRGFDEDIRTALTAALLKRGIRIVADCPVADIERRNGGVSVMAVAGDTHEADVVLMATGRAPNTRDLGLEAIGVGLDARGAIQVDARSRTAVASVYAIGDCTHRLNLTPVAVAEGRAVADSLFGGRPTAVDYRYIPTAVFSTPSVSTVGLTESDARAQLGPIDVYITGFPPMKTALSGRDERVMMKLVVERSTQRVVGCHMVGPDVAEIIQGFAVAITCGATKAQFDATVGIHPSAAEELLVMRVPRP